MAVIIQRNTLHGLRVKEATRKQVLRLHHGETIKRGITQLKKHKVDTLLVTGDDMHPLGVVSKTDIMGAYYASLPLDSPLEYILSAPVLTCYPDELLDLALERMQDNNIHTLYVVNTDDYNVQGVLTYGDIVGLLYQYCCNCKLSKWKNKGEDDIATVKWLQVKELATHQVVSACAGDSLGTIIELLSGYRFGGVLIVNEQDVPCGSVSKVDLLSAYLEYRPLDTPATHIMTGKITCCKEDGLLEEAIRRMVLAEAERLFIYRETPDDIVGVISLSDMARLRSGSCHACMVSRIEVS